MTKKTPAIQTISPIVIQRPLCKNFGLPIKIFNSHPCNAKIDAIDTVPTQARGTKARNGLPDSYAF